MRFITLRNDRNISLKNLLKNLLILLMAKGGNITPARKYHYEQIYTVFRQAF